MTARHIIRRQVSATHGGVYCEKLNYLPSPSVGLHNVILSKTVNETQRVNMLKETLSNECDGNSIDERGRTFLMESVEQRSLDCVDALLNSGIDIDVNQRDCQGNTALHYCFKGIIAKEEFFRALLQNGASLNISNLDGLTPANFALFSQSNIFGLFLSFNFTASSFRYLDYLRLRKNFGLTTLSFDTLLLLKRIYYYGGKLTVCKKIRKINKPDKQVDDWLEEISTKVQSLQHITRLKIRTILSSNVKYEVKKLPVPQSMQNYILMNEIM